MSELDNKIVINLNDYSKGSKEDKVSLKVLEDGNKSYIISGISGHGKDAISMSILDIDMENSRTAIILDTKMEYPSCIFMQQDDILKNILSERGISPASYDVDLWLPYIEGMEKDKHFRDLLRYKHPKLRIRPFRILYADVQSDTRNFALQLSGLQSLADEETRQLLKGMAKDMMFFREQAAGRQMIFDKYDRREQGCGWEYMDFEALVTNKKINVLSFYFMTKSNTVVAISTAIGILNELLSKGMVLRGENETFAIYIPELQLMMPKRIKQLTQIADTLMFRLTTGYLLQRSFHARMRINLQNLSRLDSDLFSQSNILIGKTRNPSDLNLLQKQYQFNKLWIKQIFDLPIGKFVDIQKKGNKKLFIIAPRSDKAKEREHFLIKLKAFNEHPENFLYETGSVFISDLIDIVPEGTGMTLDQYRDSVKEWIAGQPKKTLKPLQSIEVAETIGKKPAVVDDDILREFGVIE